MNIVLWETFPSKGKTVFSHEKSKDALGLMGLKLRRKLHFYEVGTSLEFPSTREFGRFAQAFLQKEKPQVRHGYLRLLLEASLRSSSDSPFDYEALIQWRASAYAQSILEGPSCEIERSLQSALNEGILKIAPEGLLFRDAWQKPNLFKWISSLAQDRINRAPAIEKRDATFLEGFRALFGKKELSGYMNISPR
jgi:hypothetical protein